MALSRRRGGRDLRLAALQRVSDPNFRTAESHAEQTHQQIRRTLNFDRGWEAAMEELKARLAKFESNAIDWKLTAKLAVDPIRRATCVKLAEQQRRLAGGVRILM